MFAGRIDLAHAVFSLETAAALHAALVAPLATALSGKTRLVISPDGPLHQLSFDALVWVAGAGAPEWIEHTGLSTDERGFVAVHDTLQSTSHPNVFAAGDVADLVNHPRPKAGVFAVREGPLLERNLVASLSGGRLASYQPQKHALALISTGTKHAVASRGSLVLGDWVALEGPGSIGASWRAIVCELQDRCSDRSM